MNYTKAPTFICNNTIKIEDFIFFRAPSKSQRDTYLNQIGLGDVNLLGKIRISPAHASPEGIQLNGEVEIALKADPNDPTTFQVIQRIDDKNYPMGTLKNVGIPQDPIIQGSITICGSIFTIEIKSKIGQTGKPYIGGKIKLLQVPQQPIASPQATPQAQAADPFGLAPVAQPTEKPELQPVDLDSPEAAFAAPTESALEPEDIPNMGNTETQETIVDDDEDEDSPF